MNLEKFTSIQTRMSVVSECIETPEAKNFNYDGLLPYLSDENKEFLSSVADYSNVYFFCLNNTLRWKDHPYQKLTQELKDSDYDHSKDMLKIAKDIEKLGLKSVNFNTVQLDILIHDGGEIITDDISNNHIATDQPLKDIKELEPKVFISVVLRQIKEKEFYGQRKKIKDLYHRYESRHNNFSDTDSHLVKLIDIFQGDNFGLENVYSKTKLNHFYGENNIPINPDNFIISMINKEISQLKIVLDSLEDPQEKTKLFIYYKDQQFSKFSNPEYGFQEIFNTFKPAVNSIGQTLPSF